METFPETVLDVGTGTNALPSLIRTCGPVVTAIDNVTDYWPDGMVNRHFHVRDEDATRKISGKYDLVTCVSVLQHIQAHDDAIRRMLEALKPGAHLALTFPYNERRYIDNVYQLPGAGYGQDQRTSARSTREPKSIDGFRMPLSCDRNIASSFLGNTGLSVTLAASYSVRSQ
jgi:trans-aconitate methyltransferase